MSLIASQGGQSFPFMESVTGMFDAWFWLDELAISKAATKNIALHRPLWEDENDNWAMVSEDSSAQVGTRARCIGLSQGRYVDFARHCLGTILLRSPGQRGCLFGRLLFIIEAFRSAKRVAVNLGKPAEAENGESVATMNVASVDTSNSTRPRIASQTSWTCSS